MWPGGHVLRTPLLWDTACYLRDLLAMFEEAGDQHATFFRARSHPLTHAMSLILLLDYPIIPLEEALPLILPALGGRVLTGKRNRGAGGVGGETASTNASNNMILSS